MASIALQHRAEILARVAAGARLYDLSKDLGITPQAISKVLKADPEYIEAIETGLELRLDLAEKQIEAAETQVDVGRAGALHRAVSWRAEREVPARWGAKQQLQVEHKVGLIPAELLSVAEKLLELRDGARMGRYVKESCDAADAELVSPEQQEEHTAPALPAPQHEG